MTDGLSPAQEIFLATLSPEAQPAMRAMLIKSNQNAAVDPDDPDIWEFNNPFTAIWTGKDATKFGYTKKKASKAKADFYTLNSDELKRFQELAFQAGYYGEDAERGDIRWGATDDKTYQIWNDFVNRSARVYASGKKNTLWDLLQDDVAKRPENMGKAKKGRPPLVTVLPDPRMIEETLMQLAPEIIGRDPDPEFIADFTAMYTSMQSEFQKNKYALEGTEEGGTITAPPPADSIAAFRLRYERPEEYERHRAAEKHMQYTQLLKGAL